MFFRQIVDEKLAQNAYLIGCQETREAIIIDPQRDIDRYRKIATKAGLRIVAATETHIHADYLSGLRQFAVQYGIKVYASDEGGNDWRYEWLHGSELDYQLLKNADKFEIGMIGFEVYHTPGHTPEHISLAVTDFGGGAQFPIGVLTGDFLFVGDVGRPDLLEIAAGQKGAMEPAARELYRSLETIKRWPAHSQVWPGHGAGSACGKSLGAVPMSTVGYELTYNRSIVEFPAEDNFVSNILDGQPEPPYYFARMKRLNREGPAIMHHNTNPQLLSHDEIGNIAGDNTTIILDCRSWQEYRKGHIARSLFTPLNGDFPTIVGSYIPEESQICLLIDEQYIQEAATYLIRIGLDNIVGYLTPQILQQYSESGGELISTEEIDVDELARRIDKDKVYVLDVRLEAELQAIGKIAGAANVTHTRLLADGGHLPNDDTINVYCRSGNRSTYACAYLEHSGRKVVHVAGGIMAWIAAGHQVSLESKK